MEFCEGVRDVFVRVSLKSYLIIVQHNHFLKTDVLADGVGHIEGIKGDLGHVVVELVFWGVEDRIWKMEFR